MSYTFAVNVDALISPHSYGRGIGRYVSGLLKNLLRSDKVNRYVFFASGEAHSAASDAALRDLEKLLGAAEARILPQFTGLDVGARTVMREQSLRGLAADVVLETSPFLGVLGYPPLAHDLRGTPTATILYDLIPYALPDLYLTEPTSYATYSEHLLSLHRADAVLCISEWTANDAVGLLGLDTGRVRTISSGLDALFAPRQNIDTRTDLTPLGVTRDFVLYVGGDDPRKNISGLVEAYAMLDLPNRKRFQLVVACSLSSSARSRLRNDAQVLGLRDTDLVLTGRVEDSELVDLYQSCHLFAFPSLYEGFGLPIVEAMACGAPVIGSDSTSVAEILKIPNAQFDATDPSSIASCMRTALTDEDRRNELRENGVERVGIYKWSSVADRVVQSLESVARARNESVVFGLERPRLAVVTPLPPERSGVANFAAASLPFLSRHYDITLVNDNVKETSGVICSFPQINSSSLLSDSSRFDRVLYQVGNSDFHSHMPALLHHVPGVIELHDLYLGELHSTRGTSALRAEFMYSHGRVGEAEAATDVATAAARWPASARLIDESLGVIVHSLSTAQAIKAWYGNFDGVFVVPMNLQPERLPSRARARERLGVPGQSLMISSFGFLQPSKLSLEILEAWEILPRGRFDACLVFVGGDMYPSSSLSQQIRQLQNHGAHIRLTGFVDGDTYRDYLAASDVVIQLRAGTRGETSGAYLDAIVAQRAIISNSNPAFTPHLRHGPRIGPHPTKGDIREALLQVLEDGSMRQAMADEAKNAAQHLDPNGLAVQRMQAIEWCYSRKNNHNPLPMAQTLVRRSRNEDAMLAALLADTFPRRTEVRLEAAP